MVYSQRRFVAVISAIVLILFAFSWLIRNHLETVSERNWIAPLALVMLLLSTVITYFRSRTVTLMRPWLVRHVIGNFILAIGVVLVWTFDLALFYYLAIALGVFVMWMWATRKLRDAVQRGE